MSRGFASDNHAGAHPEVLAAIEAANSGHAGSYGDDEWTARCDRIFRRHFGADADSFLVFNGTAANVLAIDAITHPHEAVICAQSAHLNVDEAGAPERFAGVKLLAVSSEDGKLSPERIDHLDTRRGDQHAVQPRVVSVAQASELGTIYQPGELAALAEWAHEREMALHVDGARLANAAAALGAGLGELAAGVDAVSFGGTKNGLLAGDAVVFPNGAPDGFAFVRKQGMQLASKMRFIACQFEALLDGDLWLRSASHANAMATRLGDAVGAVEGVELMQPVEANGVFARLPHAASRRLLAELPGEHPFYFWDEPAGIVRWMCAWDTTADDVDAFVQGVREAVAQAG